MFKVYKTELGGGFFKYFLIFTPILGEDEPILTSIFFKPVGWNHHLEKPTSFILAIFSAQEGARRFESPPIKLSKKTPSTRPGLLAVGRRKRSLSKFVEKKPGDSHRVARDSVESMAYVDDMASMHGQSVEVRVPRTDPVVI